MNGWGFFFQRAGHILRLHISWLKSYVTAEETFICITLNEVSQMYSTFIIMIFDNDKSEGPTPQCIDDGVIDYLAMLDSKNS